VWVALEALRGEMIQEIATRHQVVAGTVVGGDKFHRHVSAQGAVGVFDGIALLRPVGRRKKQQC